MDEQLEKVKKDFRLFLFLVFKHLGLPSPTAIQYDIAMFLQLGGQRRMVQAPRGLGKSWLADCYVCWRLLRNPDERILIVSASEKKATENAVFIKQLITGMDILRHLTPDSSAGNRDSVLAFDVAGSSPHQAPSVKVLGITSQLTGSRATLILSDDVEIPANSETQAMRDKLSEKIKEYAAILNNETDCEIVYLGTPQSAMSIYRELPDRGYDIRVWTARYIAEAYFDKYKGMLAPFITDAVRANPDLAGKPTEPLRFGEEALMKKRYEYGAVGFQLQYMLDTSASDGDRFPLKISDCIAMDLDKEVAPIKVAWSGAKEYEIQGLESYGLPGDRWHKPMWFASDVTSMVKYQGSVMFIDPSGRGKDETGYAIVNQLNSMLYLMDCGGYASGYSEETLEALAKKAMEYKVNAIVIEGNFGDGLYNAIFKPILSRIYKVSIDDKFLKEHRNSGQKETRIINTLEPLLSNHRLVVDRKLVEKDMTNYNNHPGESAIKYSLFYQMTRVTADRGALLHDDRLDALAGACAYWVDAMSKDLDKVEQDRLEELYEMEIQRFRKYVIGYVPETEGFSENMGFIDGENDEW